MDEIRGRLLEQLATYCMRVGRRIWRCLPEWSHHLPPVRWYGMQLHAVVKRAAKRDQNHSTFFFRNRAELHLLLRLADQEKHDGALKIAVIGCSKGAEVYSIAGALHLTRPDLRFSVCAVDISEEILEFAKEGVYFTEDHDEDRAEAARSGPDSETVIYHTVRDQWGTSLFERVTPIEMATLFERKDNCIRVKPWLKKDIMVGRYNIGRSSHSRPSGATGRTGTLQCSSSA